MISTPALSLCLFIALQPGRDQMSQPVPYQQEQSPLCLEGVVWLQDLRSIDDSTKAFLHYFEGSATMREYARATQNGELSNGSILQNLRELATIAAPKGEAAPTILVAASRDEAMAFELRIRTQPGVGDRLAAAFAQKKFPAEWSLERDDNRFSIDIGTTSLVGHLDSKGWLHLQPAMLEQDLTDLDSATTAALIEAKVRSAQAGAVFMGGGVLSKMLAGYTQDAAARAFFTTLESVGIEFNNLLKDGLGVEAKVLIKSPMVAAISSLFPKDSAPTADAGFWGADALSLSSIALPAQALAPFLNMAPSLLAESDYAPPEALWQALQNWTGSLSAAHFGAAGDWAVAFKMKDEASAQAMVAATQSTLANMAKKFSASDLIAPAQSQTAVAAAYVLRPDVALDGMRVFHQGARVIVASQKSRYEKLQSPQASLATTPLHPVMKDMLESHAVLSTYSVATSDGALWSWLVWPTKLIELVAKKLPGEAKDLKRLPLSMAGAVYGTSLLYDWALTLWAEQDTVTLRFAATYI